MKYKSIALLLIIIIILISLQGCINLNKKPNDNNKTNIIINDQDFSIACWNLQIFGDTKASNDTLLSFYADKYDDYDIFIVQEIRDSDSSAVQKLADKLPEYNYILSSRAGKSSNKEQYAVFYNNLAKLLENHDYTTEYQNSFERPPYKITFKVVNWTFTIFTIHIKPDDVNNELTNLENLINNTVGDTIIIGDLNADGSYYDEDHIVHFTNWSWIIGNNIDTTVAASYNTYDRIIINKDCLNNYVSSGVMNDVKNDQSDHYLVYAMFNPHEP